MSIKGQLQKGEVNKFGFFRIKVAGEWYGADKKGSPSGIDEGDIVEFEPYTNDRGYASFKFQTLKRVAASAGVQQAASQSVGAGARSGSGTSRDSYWADKEARDQAKEPRINYYAAFERATGFVALAFQVGALGALAKAKDTAKLDVLTALVDEQTQRILTASYAQVAPSVEPNHTTEVVDEVGDAIDDKEDGKWK